MPAPTRIVDSHQHVRWHQRDEHGLVADLDAHGIDYAWLLTWQLGPVEQSPQHASYLNPALTLPDGSHPGIPLSELLAVREIYPQRFVIGYCPHPLWPSAPQLLEAARHMHDVRICGEWKGHFTAHLYGRGTRPADIHNIYSVAVPLFYEFDRHFISAPLDYKKYL